jgi:hypothetical protein
VKAGSILDLMRGSPLVALKGRAAARPRAPITRARLECLGATLEVVETYHPEGGWQLSRLERLRDILDAHPGAVWPRQYDSPDNAGAYEAAMEREILDELSGRVETIYADVFLTERGLLDQAAAAAPREIRYSLDVAERWSRADLPHDGSVPYHAPSIRSTADLARELELP